MNEKQKFSLESTEEYDFLCERRLSMLSPELHSAFRSSVFAMDMLLANYKHVFPFFTSHTFEHSEQVINYCNMLLGPENAGKLNADELYILLMGASLHDIGMGVSEADFNELKQDIPGALQYISEHPDAPIGEITRNYHQEFSAGFIRKYARLFEIPGPEYVYCICQMARGHRKLDLLDQTEFDPGYTLPNGSVVRLPYLAGLIKLADELDITSDRNLFFDYENLKERFNARTAMCFMSHDALKYLSGANGRLTAYYKSDDEEVLEEVLDIENKVKKTFGEFAAVVETFPEFELVQKSVHFEKLAE